VPERRARRRLGGVAGVNLLEAALVTPLLLLLTFSIIDFASVFYVYLALENGVSQATRYAITGNTMEDPDNPGEELPREESIKIAMREATPTLTIDDGAFSFSHLPAGGAAWLAGAGGPNDVAKVTVNYTWTILTPLIRPFFADGQVNLTVESAMKNEGRFE
jgi:hypothetical protein